MSSLQQQRVPHPESHAVSLKQEVIDYAHSIGIDKIGFASANPFLALKDRLYTHRDNGYESGFEEKDIEKRTDPAVTMPEVKSIISIALAYPSRMESPPKSEKGQYRGIMARVAWGDDYHTVLRNKLKKIQTFLKEQIPGIVTESMVDTGVLSDRAVAERAGIGWVGKNTSLITPEFGSWVYLGEMLTSYPFEPDVPLVDECGECTLCIDSCPTGAIVKGGQLNSQRCVAYLTQVKDYISEEFRDAVGNRLYGCDTCQQVCPKNRKINFTHHAEFTPDPENMKPLLKPLLTIGKKEFARRFGTSSAAWRGKKPIQRNAVLALGFFKDASAVEPLIDVINQDERPAMRGTAAWALGRIGGERCQEALNAVKLTEKDTTVLKEIDKALSTMEIVE
ncbi:tRNA epoxyqueuosine(34) reductase QueG [Aneurinibacillus sp. Ricciae_BoGa-3]|uniref:tRNA epoxyqueuosine(34) reductase QueG n=1 Tax=Aneurinibacillus sp. Ricciae_BoGa-3 TaxID=3022697 RepID=UPI00233FAE49|nr:tRNA epoxyqueuosine(34) reductase QueG [Aneurinibacillus sp. Ricciae_BoGa-3]WCK55371.1 tRNA epoxyqueuosine(34) reductase QueG [Aneurinibacillus sp. Ricciae_BoGa-3]